MESRASLYGFITYVAVLVILSLSVVSPLLGLSNPSNELIMGLSITLIAYTLGLTSLGRLELFKEFRVGLGGFVGITKDLEDQSKLAAKIESEPAKNEAKVTKEMILNEMKKLVNDAKESEKSRSLALLDIIGQVERKIIDIAGPKYARGSTIIRYPPIPKLAECLVADKVISTNLANLIAEFWSLRNKVVHGVEVTNDDMNKAASIGQTILFELERVRK